MGADHWNAMTPLLLPFLGFLGNYSSGFWQDGHHKAATPLAPPSVPWHLRGCDCALLPADALRGKYGECILHGKHLLFAGPLAPPEMTLTHIT